MTRLLLLLLLLLASAAAQCPAAHRAALLRLQHHFAAPTLLSWKLETDCCSWDGVSCHGEGGEGVTGLDLSNLGISGNLSSALFDLTSLRSLNLAYNLFHGIPLPSHGFGRLRSLTYLNLSSAGFVGQVPIGIAHLRGLVTLDLSSFFLDEKPGASLHLRSPSFEVLIADLNSLQTLYLDGVNMSATGSGWSKAVAAVLPNLQELSLTGCSIAGPIDESFSKLRLLSRLLLDHNNLNCPVPDFFEDFSSLSVLGLRSCGLIGSFPKRVLRIKTLKVFGVEYNPMLSGELPEFVAGSALQTLVIKGTNFSGVIPESIGRLENLSSLQLVACQFHGGIPSSIIGLKYLVQLDLSMNNFSGEIPSFVHWPIISEVILAHNNMSGSLPSDAYGSLHNLMKIDLRENSISGQIPASLFSLSSLQHLWLSQNLFSGNLMELTNGSSTLQNIDLSGNNLQGTIPMSLFKLSGLVVLNLASNSLSGTMKLEWISGLTNLSSLDLSNNRLSVEDGDVNYSSSSYPQISTLKLASCNLSKLPGFLRYQVELTCLDLSNNHITGLIPGWIWNAGNFMYLNLSHNLFSGMDKHLLNLSSIPLTVLDLHSNKLQGSLPLPPPNVTVLDYSDNNFTSSVPSTFFSHLNSSIFLSLSNNRLTGEILSSICHAGYLQVLDLSYNSLYGSIPPCLLVGNNDLRILNLRGNKFDGFLPRNISNVCKLQTINLSNNILVGKLPESLVNCRMLEVLDVGNNHIRDTVPYWLGKLPKLRVLVLRSNEFHGQIGHPAVCNQRKAFPMLQIFDISSNHFSGYVPAQCLKNLNRMVASPVYGQQVGFVYLDLWKTQSYYQDSVMIRFKGLDITLVKILSIFAAVDLSNNALNGSIPSDIGKLKLLRGLNLSNNAIAGIIPSEIANLKQLESLDLSSNQLSGMIPPGMASLNFLSYLNLSYNNLRGSIPQSGQFNTFSNASFLGNKGLCGTALFQQCNASDKSSPPTPKAPVLKCSISLSWQFVFFGLGFGVGFAILVVPLMVWSKGKGWYNKHIDKFLVTILPMWLCNSCKHSRVRAEEWGSDDSGALEGGSEVKFCVFHTRLELIGESIRIRQVKCYCNATDCPS